MKTIFLLTPSVHTLIIEVGLNCEDFLSHLTYPEEAEEEVNSTPLSMPFLLLHLPLLYLKMAFNVKKISVQYLEPLPTSSEQIRAEA